MISSRTMRGKNSRDETKYKGLEPIDIHRFHIEPSSLPQTEANEMTHDAFTRSENYHEEDGADSHSSIPSSP